MSKKRVIIYGLGKDFKQQVGYLENEFDIIGYCDAQEHNMNNFISPTDLGKYEYDYIYITSSRYYDEIREDLLLKYKVKKEKIISTQEVFGDFRNHPIKKKWIIDKLSEIPTGKIILDAGAGECQYEPYCKHLKYIAQDLGEYNPNSGEYGGLHSSHGWDMSRVNIKCDIIDMPLENESVDVILCSEVFEHLKDPMLAIKEFSRVIKKGGELILTAPFCCLTHMAPYFYYNGFSEYWYKENLSANGFEIEEIQRNGNFFKYLAQELLRVNEMVKKYCATQLDKKELEYLVKSIKLMTKLSESDMGSSETLCFGYMVKAIKKVK